MRFRKKIRFESTESSITTAARNLPAAWTNRPAIDIINPFAFAACRYISCGDAAMEAPFHKSQGEATVPAWLG